MVQAVDRRQEGCMRLLWKAQKPCLGMQNTSDEGNWEARFRALVTSVSF